MCDPMTAAAVTVGSAIFATVGQMNTADAKEKLAFNEARNLDNQAQEVRNKGTEEENIKRQEIAKLVSKQRAAQGASGININSGSAADIQQDTAILGEVDARRIKTNYDSQFNALTTDALQTRNAGSADASTMRGEAIGSLLTSGAGIYSKGVDAGWFSADSAATVAGG